MKVTLWIQDDAGKNELCRHSFFIPNGLDVQGTQETAMLCAAQFLETIKTVPAKSDNPGMPYAGDPSKTDDRNYVLVVNACDRDRKIHAIKEVRAATGMGLKEAKDFVECDLPSCLFLNNPKTKGEITTYLRAMRSIGMTVHGQRINTGIYEDDTRNDFEEPATEQTW